MKRRFMAAALTSIMVIATLAGCGGKEAAWEDGDGKIDGDLTFWTQDSESWKIYFDEATKAFQEKYPDVNLMVEYFPEFADKATQAFAAGEQPDVMQTWQSVSEWANAGKVAAVPEDVMSKSEIESLFYEGAIKNKEYEGEYYCIPTEINVESPSLYVNMDILEAEGVSLPEGWVENDGPASWDDLVDFAASLTEKDGSGMVTRAGLAYVYAQWEANFLSLILQHGGDYKDEANMQVKFQTPEAKAAAEMLLKYCQGDDAISDDGDTRYDQFMNGLAVMCVGAPWYAGSFDIDIPDTNYQVFNMPAWVNGSDPVCLATGGWGYVVAEDSPNKEAAWAFVEFLSSAEQVGDWALTTGALPARVDALKDLNYDPEVGSAEKAIAIAGEILEYAEEDGAYMMTPSTLTYTIVREQLRQLLVDGNIDGALEAMENEGNTMIEDNYGRE